MPSVLAAKGFGFSKESETGFPTNASAESVGSRNDVGVVDTSPRPQQVQKIAALRGIGKREAQRHLEQLSAVKSTKRPRKH